MNSTEPTSKSNNNRPISLNLTLVSFSINENRRIHILNKIPTNKRYSSIMCIRLKFTLKKYFFGFFYVILTSAGIYFCKHPRSKRNNIKKKKYVCISEKNASSSKLSTMCFEFVTFVGG